MRTESSPANVSPETVVKVLNSFLRGEISAVETYRQALEELRSTPHVATIQDNLRSHEQRMDLLTREIQRRGGQPAEGSGMWGAFAKMVEGGAKALGPKAAIAALEEGEDHGRDDYQRDLDKLDPTTREFVQTRLLSEQLRTHNALSALKKSLH
jgi:demethoxyubiquinone hydroxylase (CLK1/Coq7/Cat5 family)